MIGTFRNRHFCILRLGYTCVPKFGRIQNTEYTLHGYKPQEIFR